MVYLGIVHLSLNMLHILETYDIEWGSGGTTSSDAQDG